MLNDLRTYMQSLVRQIRNDERGATMIEYGLMVALIAAIIVGIVGTLGGQVQNAFQTVSSQMP